MSKLSTLFLSGALLVAPAGLATAAPYQGPNCGTMSHMHRQQMRHRRPGMFRFMRGLNLTADQKTQIRSIIQSERANTQQLRTEMRANQQKLMGLEPNASEADVAALADQQGKLMAQMIEARQKVEGQIYNILTPEQQQQWDQMIQKREQRMQERQQRMQEHRQQMQQKSNKPAPQGN